LLLVGLVGAITPVTGFPNTANIPAVVWGGVPTSAALFAFCFSGHAVSRLQITDWLPGLCTPVKNVTAAGRLTIM
jgi:hypothetical protein